MKILIAEADPASQLGLESMLLRWGYEVIKVSDGAEASTTLQGENAPPLAILNWLLPTMDGLEVCRKVRETALRPIIYIILLASKDARQTVEEALAAGADDYLLKPFEEQDLQVRLRVASRILQLQEALWEQAKRDSLTGIWNRAMILEILERELARATREGVSCGLIMADLDYFKEINDRYGHLVGDRVLAEATQRMRASLRPYDALGRYGGEEFLIVLPHCDVNSALEVAERIRFSVHRSPLDTPAGPIAISLSLGVISSLSGQGTSSDELLRRADAALYRAKQAGRNCVALSP